uniref:Uncharacterized protein n=1 Tax=Utricularia reniformis TaxID=192314 RepID=A0A1Y0B432_9LAMI|nr:hypothetical protein AEK19_MT2012 [Utricularia reniformis]ART32172.1 hypothetical protein AEK19_MT2012 [Utricularia reniformis]
MPNKFRRSRNALEEESSMILFHLTRMQVRKKVHIPLYIVLQLALTCQCSCFSWGWGVFRSRDSVIYHSCWFSPDYYHELDFIMHAEDAHAKAVLAVNGLHFLLCY